MAARASDHPPSSLLPLTTAPKANSHAFPLPTDIPIPKDDGACNHLPSTPLPSIVLPSTAGNTTDLSTLPGLTILFCYPRTAAPGESVPDEWNAIPGARGCTPQNCAFRDLSREMAALGVKQLFGCSTQSTAYQQELRERVHLPYQILSDERLELVKGLGLPVFEYQVRFRFMCFSDRFRGDDDGVLKWM